MVPRRQERSQLTVDELTLYVQGLFLSDLMLKSLIVAGEIAEFKRHTSGHCYFTLLGRESRVACAIFKQYAGFLPRWPENGVVALLRLVLHVRDVDRDPTLALLRSLVDHVVRRVVRPLLRRKTLRYSRRQRRLAVVDVTDRSDIQMRLAMLELLLRHLRIASQN